MTSELDVSNFDEEFTTQAVESVVPDALMSMPKPGQANAFEGFTYVDKGLLG